MKADRCTFMGINASGKELLQILMQILVIVFSSAAIMAVVVAGRCAKNDSYQSV